MPMSMIGPTAPLSAVPKVVTVLLIAITVAITSVGFTAHTERSTVTGSAQVTVDSPDVVVVADGGLEWG